MESIKTEMDHLEQEYKQKNTFFKRWFAVIMLLVLFLVSWGGQLVTQMQTEKQIAAQHNQEFQLSEFWPEFWSATFENWQSEWLQLFVQALFIVGFAEVVFRKGEEQHFKTQLMINQLRKEIKPKDS